MEPLFYVGLKWRRTELQYSCTQFSSLSLDFPKPELALIVVLALHSLVGDQPEDAQVESSHQEPGRFKRYYIIPQKRDRKGAVTEILNYKLRGSNRQSSQAAAEYFVMCLSLFTVVYGNYNS